MILCEVTVWLLPFTHFLFGKVLKYTEWDIQTHHTSDLTPFYFLIYHGYTCSHTVHTCYHGYQIILYKNRLYISLGVCFLKGSRLADGFNSNILFWINSKITYLSSHSLVCFSWHHKQTAAESTWKWIEILLIRQFWSHHTRFQFAAFTPAQKNWTKWSNAVFFLNHTKRVKSEHYLIYWFFEQQLRHKVVSILTYPDVSFSSKTGSVSQR